MSTTVSTKTTTIPRFFDELASRTSEPLLHHVTGTIEWNIRGVGRWWVRINRGALHVSQSPQDADTIISCDADTFEAIINGKDTAVTAALRGALNVSGSAALALSFGRLIH